MEFIKAKKLKPGVDVVTAIQTKLDGHRVMICKDDASSIVAITRVGTDIWPKLDSLPVVARAVSRLPNWTRVDCELHCPGVPATSVKTMINDLDKRLKISAFALVVHRGEPGEELSLMDACRLLADYGFDVPHTDVLFKSPRPLNEDTVASLKREARDRKIEGYIAKESHLRGWYKIKPTNEVDAVITGWHRSSSITFGGLIKGISCSLWDPEEKRFVEICDTGNGLSTEFKERMADNEDSLLGKIVMLEYDSVAAKGRLKFPRIVTGDDGLPIFRDDKLGSDCLMSQIA